ncbi:MAG: hypothetical protein ACRDF6_14310, partial [bacterium]
VLEDPSYYQDFVAADRAVERAVRRDVFSPRATEIFNFRWYIRTLEILDEILAKDWTGTQVPVPVRRRVETLLSRHPDGEIAVEERFRLNVLRKK